uniref:Uncharacterized protein n=1 Tax=Syphacia muris TaxID=451379 RepID=A0A0N5AY50_9BILA
MNIVSKFTTMQNCINAHYNTLRNVLPCFGSSRGPSPICLRNWGVYVIVTLMKVGLIVVVIGSFAITLKEYEAAARTDLDKIHLRSEVVCKYSRGYCMDYESGETIWHPIKS